MKTVNNLFDKICTKENILLAIHKAARGKRKKRVVQLMRFKSTYLAK